MTEQADVTLHEPINSIEIVVVGCGAYTCGRGILGNYGTIIPGILEFCRACSADIGSVGITVVGFSSQGLTKAREKISELQALVGVEMQIRFSTVAHFQFDAMPSVNKLMIVAVPDAEHSEWLRLAARHGYHALVVKPFVDSFEEGLEITQLFEEKGLLGYVEFHKRFDRQNILIRERLKELGELHSVTVEYSQRIEVPLGFGDWINSSNILQYLGVHYIDLLHFLTGCWPESVTCIGSGRTLLSKGFNTFDSTQALIKWCGNGQKFTQSITASWCDPDKTSATSYQRLKISGSQFVIESDQKRRGLQIVTDMAISEPNPDFTNYCATSAGVRFFGYGIDSIMAVCNRVFFDKSNDNLCSFDEALASTAAIDALNKSMSDDCGAWVEVRASRRG